MCHFDVTACAKARQLAGRPARFVRRLDKLINPLLQEYLTERGEVRVKEDNQEVLSPEHFYYGMEAS